MVAILIHCIMWLMSLISQMESAMIDNLTIHRMLSGLSKRSRAVQIYQTDGYNHVYRDILCMGCCVCTIAGIM